jgi:hypothetical protein
VSVPSERIIEENSLNGARARRFYPGRRAGMVRPALGRPRPPEASSMDGLRMETSEIIELMMTSSSRWESVRCEGLQWQQRALAKEAFETGMEAEKEALGARGGQAITARLEYQSTTPQPEEEVQTWKLWVAPPSRIRTEFIAWGSETVTVVVDGPTWWSRSPTLGALTNDGDRNSEHGLGPGYPLLSPLSLTSVLDLEVTGEMRIARRGAYEVRGRPKAWTRERPWDLIQRADLDEFGFGADAYQLGIDVERGIILRSEAQFGGRPFSVLEVSRIAFDEPTDPEVFVLRLPPGERFEHTREWRERRRREMGFPEREPPPDEGSH